MGNGKVSEQIMGREPYRFMFMESLENFRNRFRFVVLKNNSGTVGEEERPLMRRVMINAWLRDG